MTSRQHSGVLSASRPNARQAAAKQAGAAKAGGDGRGQAWAQALLPAIQEEEAAGTPVEKKKPPQAVGTEEEDSPLSKFKDWQAVAALDGRAPAPTALPPAHPAVSCPAKDRVQAAQHPSTHLAADVASLVQAATILAQAAASRSGGGGTDRDTASPANVGADRDAASGLSDCLAMLAEPSVLAAASDGLLAQLLHGLQPLLRYSPATRQWAAPGLTTALGPLQHTCQERLVRAPLACDTSLAAATASFFSRVIQEAGGGLVADSLLQAAAAYTRDNCGQLSGEVLAGMLSMLATARHQPSGHISFGNRCVERLLRLSQASGLQLTHFADVVEALAQLRCVDGLSASPVVNLAVASARQLEEGRQLDVPQLTELARVMGGVAVIAATTSVHSATLVAATATWHMLTMRAEALAQQGTGALLGPALSRMWWASRMLMAVAQAAAAPGFQLPERLGLVSHAAWLEQEHRMASGLTSAQRRVLAALGALKVPPCKVAVNTEFLDIFQINVAVRIRLKSSNQMRQTAILIRDPQRQLMRGRSSGGGGWGAQHGGAALGAEAAQERILQAAGWHVVCLDSQTVLQLPAHILSEELGALMLGDSAGSSLRFVA